MGCALGRQPEYAIPHAAGGEAVVPILDDILLSTCALQDGFACGSVSGNIYTYVKPYGESIQPWEKVHKRGVNALVSHGSTVLSAGGEGKVCIWNAETRESSTTLEHDLSVMGVDFLAADRAASGSRDNVVKVWDLTTQQELGSCCISRNVVTSIRAWDSGFIQASEDLQLRHWSGDAKLISSAASGPNQLICIDVHGNYAIAGSKGFSRESCCIHLVDIRKNLCAVMEPIPAFDHAVHGIRVGTDGCGIAVCKDGHYREFNLRHGLLSLDDPLHSGQLLQSVSLGHSVKFMAGQSKVHVA